VSNLATSCDRSGSSPVQSRHWNLRPPIFQSKNRMGLRHFGQLGGGEFFGIALTLDQARVRPNSLSPITAEISAMMPDLKADGLELSVRCRTKFQIAEHLASANIGTLRALFLPDSARGGPAALPHGCPRRGLSLI
jgi:hypothetical protein